MRHFNLDFSSFEGGTNQDKDDTLVNFVDGSIRWIATSFDLDQEKGIRLYPNPASEFLYFEAAEDLDYPCKISITDVLGREVLIKQLNTGREQISLSGSLPSDGIYNIVISNRVGEQAYKGRFILLK